MSSLHSQLNQLFDSAPQDMNGTIPAVACFDGSTPDRKMYVTRTFVNRNGIATFEYWINDRLTDNFYSLEEILATYDVAIVMESLCK